MSRSDEQRIADILEAAVELAQIVKRGETNFLHDAMRPRGSPGVALVALVGSRLART